MQPVCSCADRTQAADITVGLASPIARGSMATIRRALPVGQGLTVCVTVADTAEPLSYVVPLARRLADHVSSQATREARAGGQPITCRKGCATCCSYLVPISIPETIQLRADLSRMDTSLARRFIQNFARAATRIVQAGRPPVEGPDPLAALSAWYGELRLPCPLLARNACQAYSLRPAACREHLVTFPAERCLPSQTQDHALQLPVSIAQALTQLAAEMEAAEPESVLLPLALEWLELNPGRAARTYPAPAMVERLLDILAGSPANPPTADPAGAHRPAR